MQLEIRRGHISTLAQQREAEPTNRARAFSCDTPSSGGRGAPSDRPGHAFISSFAQRPPCGQCSATCMGLCGNASFETSYGNPDTQRAY